MVDYSDKAPGVFVEEIEPAGPIAGAGTSVAAIIGVPAQERRPPDQAGRPEPITNWTGYTAAFGGYDVSRPLAYAVRGFLENGGTVGYVLPVDDAGAVADAVEHLTRLPEVSLVCAPGITDPAAQKAIIGHCEDMGDRFAVLDGALDDAPLKADGPLRTQRAGLLSKGGYAALYWPWITITNPRPTAGQPAVLTVPPSGHIAGVMARTDARVGVHKAPANEPVRGALDLSYTLNDAEQGQLNAVNINALRRFPGQPPLVWGARTLTDTTAWRYVNVRRLVAYVEDSIRQGVRWAVFAPNDVALWKGLERTITEFLTRVWEAGALFGRTAAQAFYVKIDEELNPASVRDLGQVVVEIGLAPTRPAEYVVVRFGLWTGGARVTEG